MKEEPSDLLTKVLVVAALFASTYVLTDLDHNYRPSPIHVASLTRPDVIPQASVVTSLPVVSSQPKKPTPFSVLPTESKQQLARPQFQIKRTVASIPSQLPSKVGQQMAPPLSVRSAPKTGSRAAPRFAARPPARPSTRISRASARIKSQTLYRSTAQGMTKKVKPLPTTPARFKTSSN